MTRFIITAALLLASLTPAMAETRAADAGGAAGRALWVDNNSRGGTCSDERAREDVTASTPWCTLGAAGLNAQAGDVVTVRAGVYRKTQTCDGCRGIAVLEVRNSGAAGRPLRFVAADGEDVIIDGTGGPPDGVLITGKDRALTPKFIEIDGFEIRNFATQGDITGNCIIAEDADDVTLRNLDIHGCTGSAVEFHRTARSVLEYSRVHDNAMDGYTSAVDLYQCREDNVVRGNFIWNNSDTDANETEGHGIIQDVCTPGAGMLVENNVIWGNEGLCIVAFKSDAALIRHNTCWHNSIGRVQGGELSVLGSNAQIYNNLLVPERAGKAALLIRSNDEFTVDLSKTRANGNLIWSPDNQVAVGVADTLYYKAEEYPLFNPYGWGQDVVLAEPKLIDPASGNFFPAADSPAVGAALQTQSAPLDLLRQVRPIGGRSDIGAYEFSVGGPPLADWLFRDGFE